MAHDGSIASQIEDWLIAKIQAIQFSGAPVFNAEDVKPWGGGQQHTVDDFKTHLFAGARPYTAQVFYADEALTYLDGVEQLTRPRWVIAIGAKNFRNNAEARRGDVPATGTARVGTNGLRDLVRHAIDGEKPLSDPTTVINDGTFAVHKVRVLNAELVHEEAKQVILAIYVTVDQVRTA